MTLQASTINTKFKVLFSSIFKRDKHFKFHLKEVFQFLKITPRLQWISFDYEKYYLIVLNCELIILVVDILLTLSNLTH